MGSYTSLESAGHTIHSPTLEDRRSRAEPREEGQRGWVATWPSPEDRNHHDRSIAPRCCGESHDDRIGAAERRAILRGRRGRCLFRGPSEDASARSEPAPPRREDDRSAAGSSARRRERQSDTGALGQALGGRRRLGAPIAGRCDGRDALELDRAGRPAHGRRARPGDEPLDYALVVADPCQRPSEI